MQLKIFISQTSSTISVFEKHMAIQDTVTNVKEICLYDHFSHCFRSAVHFYPAFTFLTIRRGKGRNKKNQRQLTRPRKKAWTWNRKTGSLKPTWTKCGSGNRIQAPLRLRALRDIAWTWTRLMGFAGHGHGRRLAWRGCGPRLRWGAGKHLKKGVGRAEELDQLVGVREVQVDFRRPYSPSP